VWWDGAQSSTAPSKTSNKEGYSVLEQAEEEPGASSTGSAHPGDTLSSTG